MTLLDDMKDYLLTHVSFDISPKQIFIDNRPNDPANLVVLSEYQGSGIATGIDDFTNRSVQILVRNASSRMAQQQIWDIFKIFNNAETREVRLGDRLTLMYPRQTPFKMAIDGQQRVMWVFNMGVSTKFDFKE